VRHFKDPKFKPLYDALPARVRELADKNFALLKRDPKHPSLAALMVTVCTVTVVAAGIGTAGVVAPAVAQAPALTKEQAAATAAYDKALRDFKAVLAQRRAQIDGKQKLPGLPGQAIYLARIKVMSTYKDLTDAVPSRSGRPNRFGVPPAYFDADIELLIEEYAALFRVMQAPPAGAQAS
jgi:hypothetical protein